MITAGESSSHRGYFAMKPHYHKSFRYSIPRQNPHPKNVLTTIVCGAGFDPDAKGKKPPTVKNTNLEESSSPTTKSSMELDDSEIEARLMQRRMRKKQKTQGDFKVDTESGPNEQVIEFEQNAIYALLSLFSLIIINGIIIASSGFLPDSIDKFVQTILYPSFSPLVGVFLAGSVLYGVWKTRSEKKDNA
eukprot:g7337.t1